MQRVIQAAGIFQPMRCMRAKLARLQARARARRRDRRAAIKSGRDLSVPKALSRRAEAAPTFQIPPFNPQRSALTRFLPKPVVAWSLLQTEFALACRCEGKRHR